MPEKRILLVEDDEDVGELLALTLADAGYQVDVATTAAESWSVAVTPSCWPGLAAAPRCSCRMAARRRRAIDWSRPT